MVLQLLDRQGRMDANYSRSILLRLQRVSVLERRVGDLERRQGGGPPHGPPAAPPVIIQLPWQPPQDGGNPPPEIPHDDGDDEPFVEIDEPPRER